VALIITPNASKQARKEEQPAPTRASATDVLTCNRTGCVMIITPAAAQGTHHVRVCTHVKKQSALPSRGRRKKAEKDFKGEEFFV
jgi:hypothetical protein